MNIYVVWWQWQEAVGVTQAFRTREAADKFCKMMMEHGDSTKIYAVAEVPFVKE